MDREKKLGIIYIIIGICIPLMILPFVAGYEKDKDIFHNFYRIGIPIRDEKQNIGDSKSPDYLESNKSKFSQVLSKMTPKRIPFRFFLVITLVLFYMGIVRIDAARRRKNNPTALNDIPKETPDSPKETKE